MAIPPDSSIDVLQAVGSLEPPIPEGWRGVGKHNQKHVHCNAIVGTVKW